MSAYRCANCDSITTLTVHGECEECGSSQVYEIPENMTRAILEAQEVDWIVRWVLAVILVAALVVFAVIGFWR